MVGRTKQGFEDVTLVSEELYIVLYESNML